MPLQCPEDASASGRDRVERLQHGLGHAVLLRLRHPGARGQAEPAGEELRADVAPLLVRPDGYSDKLEPSLVGDLKRIIIVGEIKESFGILRAALNGIFTKKSISKEDYNKVVALNSVIHKFMQDFDDYNPKEYSVEFDYIARKKRAR